MNVREKLVKVLQSLGYKVYEDVELKGLSGLSYAIDIYAVKEDPFVRIRLGVLIPETRITKDLVLHAKMLYSDVKELDRVILVSTHGIDKEAYKLAESGFQVLIVSSRFIDELYLRLQGERIAEEGFKEEEFSYHVFKILVDEKKAKKNVKKFLLSHKLANAKIVSVELIYRPYYLVYYRGQLENRDLFGGLAVDAVTGKVESKLNKLVSGAPSLLQKRLLKPEDIPVEIQEPQVPEERVKEIVEHLLLGNNPEIVKIQLVYVPFWKFAVRHGERMLVIEVDATTGEILSSIDEQPSTLEKFLAYLYYPELILEDLFHLSKVGYSRLSEQDKKLILYILAAIVIIFLLLLL